MNIDHELAVQPDRETGTDLVLVSPIGQEGFSDRFETGGDMAFKLGQRDGDCICGRVGGHALGYPVRAPAIKRAMAATALPPQG